MGRQRAQVASSSSVGSHLLSQVCGGFLTDTTERSRCCIGASQGRVKTVGWCQGEQHFSDFTWYDADYKVKWDSALHLCKGVADMRLDFQDLEAGLATQALRQLILDGQSQKDTVKTVTKRALEECQPTRLVSDCKGVAACLHALRAGCMQPKGRRRDLERRALVAMPAGVTTVWTRGSCAPPDLQGHRMADTAANNGTRAHVPLEPSEEWKHWGTVSQAVRYFGLLVGPKLRTRPENWPRVRLAAPEVQNLCLLRWGRFAALLSMRPTPWNLVLQSFLPASVELFATPV
eukprot:3347521-Amphidinium_carterae.1